MILQERRILDLYNWNEFAMKNTIICSLENDGVNNRTAVLGGHLCGVKVNEKYQK